MKDRKLNRRDFLQMAGLTAAGVALAACAPAATPTPAASELSAPPADTEATLTIFNFGGDADKKIYADAEARFNERYPKVTVVDNFVPVDTWGNFTNKFATAIAGGQVLDILHIAIEGNRMVVTKNILRPIDDLMQTPESAEMVNDIAQPLKDSLAYKGKYFLIPDSWNNMCIHYNTRLFSEAGLEPPKEDWTWDDFLVAAQTLTKGEGEEKVWGFAIPGFNFGLQPWFLTNVGTGTLSDDWTKSMLDDPKATETMQFLYDLVYKLKVAPTIEGTDNGQLFAAGKVAMTGFGHWPIQSYIANNFTEYDVQYWPGKEKHTSVFGVGGWGIPTTAPDPSLAWELLKDLCSLETMEATASAGVAIPARRSVAESEAFISSPPNAKIFYECLRDAKPVPSPSNFAEVEEIFMRHFTEMMSDAATPEEATAAAHTELSAAMAKVTD